MEELKKKELEIRSIELLEKTKKKMEKYAEQRKKLDEYLRNESDEEEWEKFVEEFEKEVTM